MKYGERIRTLREVLELSQEELANKLSINPRTVSYWENNQREISKDHLVLLINDLGVNPFWLMWDCSKFANKNIDFIENFLRLEITSFFMNKKIVDTKHFHPDRHGNVEVFYSGQIEFFDLLDDFVYDENDFIEEAGKLISEIDDLLPHVETLKTKISQLKKLFDQRL